jgi:hypothetical protein
MEMWSWFEKYCQIDHFNLLTKIARKKNIDLKNSLRFIRTLNSMYNDVNTYTKRNKERKNKMIALNDMPLMIFNQLQIYFS